MGLSSQGKDVSGPAWKSRRTTASPKICTSSLKDTNIYSLSETNTIGYVCCTLCQVCERGERTIQPVIVTIAHWPAGKAGACLDHTRICCLSIQRKGGPMAAHRAQALWEAFCDDVAKPHEGLVFGWLRLMPSLLTYATSPGNRGSREGHDGLKASMACPARQCVRAEWLWRR